MFGNIFPKIVPLMRQFAECGRAGQTTDDTLRSMRLAYRINTVTDTHSEYVALVASPLQQWLHERTSMLRYTHIASLVCV